jgi:hypothetical protein
LPTSSPNCRRASANAGPSYGPDLEAVDGVPDVHRQVDREQHSFLARS